MNDNLNGVQNPNPNMAPGAPAAPMGGIPEMPAAGMQPMAPAAPAMPQPMAPAAPAMPQAPAAPMGGIPEMPAGGIPEMTVPAAPAMQPMAPAAPVMPQAPAMAQPMAPAAPAMPQAPAMAQPMAPAAPAMPQPMAAPGPVPVNPAAMNPMGPGPMPATPVAPVVPAAPAMPQMPGAMPQPNQSLGGKEKKPKGERKGPPKKIIIGAAVLVVGLLFFLVGLPFINSLGEGSSVDSTKGEAYISGAKDYIKYVKDNLPSYGAGFTCGESTNSLLLTLHDLKDFEKGISKSPFGGDIDMSASFVEVDAVPSNGACEYVYYIYITDGKYSIGTDGSPVKENELKVESIIEV